MVTRNKRKIYYLIIIIFSLMTLLSYFHPTFYTDEPYTLSLISHSYIKLININMFDVHPPTYYIILKFFLDAFTFWTSSFIIKIFFARLFSFIIFLITFFELRKILKYCNIHINYFIQLFIYMLLPAISLNSINIRMYALYGLFSVLTYIELIKYDLNGNNKCLFFVIIYAVITSYVDYFAAVCVGMFFLIFIIKDICNKKLKKSINILLSGIIVFILCIPLELLLLKQIMLRSKYPVGLNITLLHGISDMVRSYTQTGDKIATIVLALIFIVLTIYSVKKIKNKKFNSILIYALTNFILSLILTMLICVHFNIFESRFFYPQFVIYSFLLMSVFILMFQKTKCKSSRFMIDIMILSLLFVNLGVFINNYMNYIRPSVHLENIVNKDKNNVYIKYSQIPKTSLNNKPLFITQYCTWLKYDYNKKLILTNCTYNDVNNISLGTVNGKTYLLKNNFNNLKFIYKLDKK